MDTVLYIDPITNRMAAMPVEMISAYVPFASDLHLEEAAKVAAIRDDEAATNLLLSIVLDEHDTEYQKVIAIPEGSSSDVLSVEPPSLR
jgi:hypothetical protein